MKTPDYRSPALRLFAYRVEIERGSALRLACLALLAAIPFAASHSQTTMNRSGNPSHDYSGNPPMKPIANPMPDANRFMTDSMKIQDNLRLFQMLNAQRQKEMHSETERLLALANQLKAETDRVSSSNLSMDVVRQAEQIEKLAHSVREKMKASVSN